MNPIIASFLNFIIGVLLIVIGLHLLGVTAPENFVSVIQQIVGLLFVVYGAKSTYIKGN